MSDLLYTYRFVKCKKCGNEFLVERVLMGIDHTMDIIVSCKACLKKKGLNEAFAKERPDAAKAIRDWLEGEVKPQK